MNGLNPTWHQPTAYVRLISPPRPPAISNVASDKANNGDALKAEVAAFTAAHPTVSNVQTHKANGGHRAIAFLVGFIAVISILIALAPRPMHKPVDPSVITNTPNPCMPSGHIVSAVQTDHVAGTVGNNLYQVTCSNGTVPLVALPAGIP